MLKRPLSMMALGFLFGILVVITKSNWILLAAIGVGILVAAQIHKRQIKFTGFLGILAYILCFFLGAYRCQSEQEFMAEYASVLEDDMLITIQGELEEKEYKNEKYFYYLKNCYLVLPDTDSVHAQAAACNQMIAVVQEDTASIGKVLVMEGKINTFRASVNEGNFDEKSFYQSQKINFKLEEATIRAQYGTEDVFRESLFLLRQRIKKVYEICLPKETGGVLVQMTLGDKSLLNQEIKELYQKVGISHVLAISGLHISVIGMTIYKLFRKLFGSFVWSGIFAGSFMFAYGCMTGFGTSSIRAILMFLLTLTAQMLGRSYDSLSALSLSAIVLLWENPFLIFYAGFLFSFAAVIGVVLVGKIVIGTLDKKQKILQTFYGSFSLQLMTLPLTAYFYFEIPVYGMLINFLILPFMSILLFVGLVGGIIGLFWLKAAKWILVPCQFILMLYKWLAGIIECLPAAVWITGKPLLERIICYYLLLFIILFFISQKKKQRFFGLLGTCLLLFVFQLPKGGMEVDVLDVGQGDGIYLKTESGNHLFIDGGSSDVSGVGNYRILPFLKCKGVRKIDYWFVSHTDKDHISGLKEVLKEGYEIAYLVFAENMVRDESFEVLKDLADENQTNVIFMGYGDCLHLGEAELTCVFPYDEFVNTDKNAASLVLFYQEKEFTGLFTGDIGEKEEGWIAERFQGEDLTFYKAAHHGSKYSNSKELLKVLQPEIAVISYGVGNSYGHPHKETLQRLEEAGCEVWNTAECGQVTIKILENKATVSGFLGGEIKVYGIKR